MVSLAWLGRLRALLFGRKIVTYCARCGRVRDNGQKLPRGTRAVCGGTFNFGLPGEEPWIRCLGFLVEHR
jgi:hypothetical protein